MPVRNQNWYDLQAGRRYPLDDNSTGLDNDGNFINDSIIVDCHIRFPASYGGLAYVQAITVTNNIVTVLIGAGALKDSTDNMSIAAVSLVKPTQLNKNYPITPLADGVAGWIVFGDGIKTNFTGRYATPAQTLINPRNARSYVPLPVTSLRKIGVGTGLTGLVTIDAEAPVVVEKKTITINSKTATALVFRTDTETNNFRFNPLQYFLGPCSQRPESGTCPKTPIETINGVGPDCNGDLKLVASGLSLYPFNPKGGIGIDLPIGLSEVCDTPTIPRQPVDDCESSSSSTSGSSSSASSQSSSSGSGGGASSSSGSPIPNIISAGVILRAISENFEGTAVWERTIVATAAATINYQWQYSDDQIGWQNVINGTAYKAGYSGSETTAGATTSVLTITSTRGGIGNADRKYRVILSSFGASNLIVYAEPITPSGSSSSSSASSSSAIPLSFIAQPSETTIIAGGTITFNYTVLSPTQLLSDRLWQYSDNDGATWLSAGKGSITSTDGNPTDGTTILGALALTNVPAIANNRLYRVTVQAQNGASITSTPARLTVIPIASSSSSSSSASALPQPSFSNWTVLHTFPATPKVVIGFNSLTYGNNRWIGVGNYPGAEPDGIYTMALSNNGGTSWAGINTNATTVIPASVAFGSGKFVAVGIPTSAQKPNAPRDIITSPDGSTWTARFSGLSPTGLRGVTYLNNNFIAVGDRGKIIVSPDGVNWTNQSVDSAYNIFKVVYGNGKYFAIGDRPGGDGYRVAIGLISENGSSWRVISMPGSHRSYASAFGAGKFVLFGVSAFMGPGIQELHTSTDAVNWTKQQLPERLRIAYYSGGISALIFAANTFYGLVNDEQYTGKPGPNVRGVASLDGINWTEVNAPPQPWGAIAYGDNKLLAASGPALVNQLPPAIAVNYLT